MKLYAPKGGGNVSIGGVEYKVEADGSMEVPAAHVDQIRALGFLEEADPKFKASAPGTPDPAVAAANKKAAEDAVIREQADKDAVARAKGAAEQSAKDAAEKAPQPEVPASAARREAEPRETGENKGKPGTFSERG